MQVITDGQIQATTATIPGLYANTICSSGTQRGDLILTTDYPDFHVIAMEELKVEKGILANEGSLGAPAYAFQGNNNAGIYYSPTNGDINIQANTENGSNGNVRIFPDGGNGLTVSSSGKVGVGTTSPSEELEVDGNIKAQKLLASSGVETASGDIGYPAYGFQGRTGPYYSAGVYLDSSTGALDIINWDYNANPSSNPAGVSLSARGMYSYNKFHVFPPLTSAGNLADYAFAKTDTISPLNLQIRNNASPMYSPDLAVIQFHRGSSSDAYDDWEFNPDESTSTERMRIICREVGSNNRRSELAVQGWDGDGYWGAGHYINLLVASTRYGISPPILQSHSQLTGTGRAGIYVLDDDTTTTMELYAYDSALDETILSPHKFKLYEPEEADLLPWTYYSRNPLIGKEVNADISGALRALEKLTSQTFLYYEDLPESERIDVETWKTSETLRIQQEAREEYLKANPWVEISLEKAMEEKPVLAEVKVEEVVTRYRINKETRKVESYRTTETLTRKVETKATEWRLKEGVRFDEKTGKCFRPRKPEEVPAEILEVPEITLPAHVRDRLPAAQKKEEPTDISAR